MKCQIVIDIPDLNDILDKELKSVQNINNED